MAHCLNDIEEFTIDELRAEILRRETAAREHRCWYCGKNILAHTCKHAQNSYLVLGWDVDASRYVRTEDCMGHDVEYWQVDAKHTILGIHRTGTGTTVEEATQNCLQHIREEEARWTNK